MSAGKLAANIFLGLLLFFNLLLLGPGIAIQSTLLNTSFVEKQLNSLDVNALVQQEVLPRIDQIPGFNRYGSLSEAVKNALIKHQGEIKARVINVIIQSHRYVMNGGQFDLAASVKSQLLDPELGKAILADVDLKPMARELLRQMVPSVLSAYNIGPYLESAVPVLESWLKGKFTELLPQVYGYLFSGEPPPGTINIPVGDIIDRIRQALREAFIKNPPLEALNIPSAALGITFDAGWEALKRYLPVAMEMDLTTNLGGPVEFKSALDRANDAVHQTRPWVQKLQTGFWVLYLIILLLVIAILVINLDFVISSLTVGATAALSGLATLIGGLAGQGFARQAALGAELPAVVQSWLLSLVSGLFLPLIIFGIVCLVTGIVLLGTGFFLRGRRKAPAQS